MPDPDEPEKTGRLDTDSSYFYVGIAFLPVGIALMAGSNAAGLVFVILGVVMLSQAWVRRR